MLSVLVLQFLSPRFLPSLVAINLQRAVFPLSPHPLGTPQISEVDPAFLPLVNPLSPPLTSNSPPFLLKS